MTNQLRIEEYEFEMFEENENDKHKRSEANKAAQTQRTSALRTAKKKSQKVYASAELPDEEYEQEKRRTKKSKQKAHFSFRVFLKNLLASLTDAKKSIAVKRILLIALVILVLGGAGTIRLSQKSEIDELSDQINTIQKKVDNEEADKIRFQNSINNMFSQNAVIAYAENVLHMVRLNDYNLIPVKIPGQNEILMVNGNSTGKKLFSKEEKQEEQVSEPGEDLPGENGEG